ncbi:hypothetical protein CIPAW_15G185400 [Carya illinoinensis]|uniref:Uncharacterized protein n=1 Tax=Carya illinoinensis TaxID=32201 RepID=A0A8T1NEI3_CARIL|nr:hypothetical protein CIPAW_15G185400 [Carya illinoinensis]
MVGWQWPKTLKRKPFHRFQSSAFHLSLSLSLLLLLFFFFLPPKGPLIAEYLLVSACVCFQSMLFTFHSCKCQPFCRTQHNKENKGMKASRGFYNRSTTTKQTCQ